MFYGVFVWVCYDMKLLSTTQLERERERERGEREREREEREREREREREFQATINNIYVLWCIRLGVL